MDKFTDLLKDLFNDRLKNPLTMAFIISWCFWNYKFLMIIFSKNTVSTTISLINTYSFPDKLDYITYGLIFPLLSSLAYIFLYPIPSKMVYSYHLNKNIELKKLITDIEKSEILTIEESQKLREHHINERNKWNILSKEKDMEIQALSEEIQNLKKPSTQEISPPSIDEVIPAKNIESENKEPTNLKKAPSFNSDASELLEFIADNSDYRNFIKRSFIEKNFQTKETLLKSLLAYLEEQDFIEEGYDPDDGGVGFNISAHGLIEVGKNSY